MDYKLLEMGRAPYYRGSEVVENPAIVDVAIQGTKKKRGISDKGFYLLRVFFFGGDASSVTRGKSNSPLAVKKLYAVTSLMNTRSLLVGLRGTTPKMVFETAASISI